MKSGARLARRLLRALLPIALLIAIVFVAIGVWLGYAVTRPPRAPYLVTPQTFSRLTGPTLPAEDVTWKNHDGTTARGWLIRGADGAPAIILLHRYGADRSWLLNLAVKMHETTNFTVLSPDLRGHGENPTVGWSLPGGLDGDDATAAIDYLHTLKTPAGKPQIAGRIGVYGAELGAYAATDAARRSAEIRALVLDSVPAAPGDLVRAATVARTGTDSRIVGGIAELAVRLYALGKFQRTSSCDLARATRDVRVLLVSGREGDRWRASTLDLMKCFNPPPQTRKDLVLTGANLTAATGVQEEAYDRPIIDFFDRALR